MDKEKKQENISAEKKVPETKKTSFGAKPFTGKGRFGDKSRRPRRKEKESEFDQKIIEIARVTRVTAGGKRMRFRACVVIGDRKGKIGMAVMKGADVTIAVNKAVNKAKKDMITVKTINETIPHEIKSKFGGAQVFMKPAKAGTGVIAGGVIRSVIELSGIKNIVTKIQGSKGKINNVKAALNGLENLRTAEDFENLRKK